MHLPKGHFYKLGRSISGDTRTKYQGSLPGGLKQVDLYALLYKPYVTSRVGHNFIIFGRGRLSEAINET